jgi:LPS O-antigen subunit length determinant protein (WzzB/FepE family)
MLIVIITFIIVIAIYVYTIAIFLKKEAINSIQFDNEDDAFASILSQIFKSKTEEELKNIVKYIFAYDDQFNKQEDVEYFIDIWDKRMKSLKPNQTI